MKTSDNETVTEVCAELKEAASGENVSCDGLVVEISQDEIWDACERIEAAHGREVAELRECLRCSTNSIEMVVQWLGKYPEWQKCLRNSVARNRKALAEARDENS